MYVMLPSPAFCPDQETNSPPFLAPVAVILTVSSSLTLWALSLEWIVKSVWGAKSPGSPLNAWLSRFPWKSPPTRTLPPTVAPLPSIVEC